MTLQRIARIALLTIIIPVLVIVALISILMIADVSIPLDGMQRKFIDKAKQTTGRDVSIDGEVRLAVSFFPTLIVNELRILNGPGWQKENILIAGEARIQIALLPLINGQLDFLEISAQRVSINLEQKADQKKNWTENDRMPEHTQTKQTESGSIRQFSDRLSINQFKLSDLTLNYHDSKTGRTFSNHIKQLLINSHDRSRLTASLSGDAGDTPYLITATSDLLSNIVNKEPWKLEAQGHVGKHPVSLETEIDTSAGTVDGKLKFHAKDVKVGNILNLLQITDGLEVFSRELQINANLKGGSLNEIINQSTFKITLTDGTWKLNSHVDSRSLDISFNNATIESIETQELKVSFNGMIEKHPIDFVFRSNPLGDFVRGINEAKLAFDARLADAKIKLSGNVNLPVSSKTLTVNLSVAGESLDQLNSVMISDLPPFGPYTLTGKFQMSPNGIHVTNVKSVIGSSDLGGTIDIDMTKNRPLWKMKLVSNELQINDFSAEGYTLMPGKEKVELKNSAEAQSDMTARENERELSRKLDQRLVETRDIDQWDIDVAVVSQNILSGRERIGEGEIILSAREDSFDQSIKIVTSGGKINNSMGLKLFGNTVSGYMKLDIDKFDYGVFLHRIAPDTEAGGLLSTRVNLQLEGDSFSRRFDRASGTLDFSVWPSRISAGDIDIWALNIFELVSSSVTSTESRLNCAVGLLDIKNGQLNEQFLGVDTSKVWLQGNLDINFPDEKIELALIPRAKKPKVGGIETPVYLKGNLRDKFDMSALKVRNRDKVKTFFSILFSPLHAPMRRIFGDKIPADGSEICGKLLDRKYLQSIKDDIKTREITIDDAYSFE